jgi:hypothetical protein
MVADWNDVTDANDTAMTAYIAMRASQDHVTITRNQAIQELLAMGGIDQSVKGNTMYGMKSHGNRFAP